MSTRTLSIEAEDFEEHRAHLLGIGYRMTGSLADAEDLVQDAWLRWQSGDRGGVESPRSFLATIVTRLALDHLKSARVRREQYVGEWLPEPIATDRFAGEESPERAVEVAESLSYASMVLLERLTPAERAVFLLRDVFDYDYREIAPVVERSEAACRQLAHRARERLAEGPRRFRCSTQDAARMLHAFSRAAASGDMEGLTQVLAEDVVMVSDGGGKRSAASRPLVGRQRVAKLAISGTRLEPPDRAQIVTLNGMPALAIWSSGELRSLFFMDINEDGQVSHIFAMRNPDKLHEAARVANSAPRR